MTYARLFELLDVAQLSPERAAPALGVAGMTLRRWRALPPDASVPELYARAFEGAVAEMAASGEIAADHPLVADILVRRGGVSFQAAARALGFEGDGGAARGSERVLEGLARIGSDPVKARAVEDGAKRFDPFSRISEDWRRNLATLRRALRSARLGAADKLIAYGALFYVLAPFDLIPDAIPGFGLIDDFAILALACVHYRKRFAGIFDG